MRVVFGAALLVAALAAARVAPGLVPLSGVLDSYEQRLVDRCDALYIAPGTEDIAIDRERDVAFVAAGDRRAWYHGRRSDGPSPSGGVFLVDLADPASATRVSPPGWNEGFLPHGIDLWRGADGERRLFVVNHPPSGEEIVEIFDIDADHQLTHVESVSFDAMYSPNDVVAVGPRQFYATNDRRYDRGLMALAELYLWLPLTSIVYFDGEGGDFAARGLAYANGVNQSPDGRTIYVAELLKRRIVIYDRDGATNTLTKKGAYKVNTAPDNIDVDADGVLWIGGHPRPLMLKGHARDAKEISPSHVVKVDPATGVREDVFFDETGVINASSVGAAHGGKLLVGAVFDPHIMVCSLD